MTIQGAALDVGKRMIYLQLDTDEIVAGNTLTGAIAFHAGLSDRVVRLELIQTDETRGHTSTFSHQSAPLRAAALAPHQGDVDAGNRVQFTYAIPTWAPPSFDHEHISNHWKLAAFLDDSPLDRVEAEVRILPAASGSAIEDRRSAQVEWRRQEDHWVSLPTSRRSSAWLVGVIVVIAVAASVAGWRYGLVGGLIAFAACIPGLIRTTSTVRRQRSSDRDGDIHLSAIPPVVESGQSVTIDVDAPGRAEVSVSLVCRAWRFTDFDGASYCVPHVVHERVVTVPTRSRVELQIPFDALPSVTVGPSAIHWTISAAGSELDSVDNPGVQRHLIVLARSSAVASTVAAARIP